MTDAYQPGVIEPAWRARWQAEGLDRTPEDKTRPKFYCLDFFPYPSGDGLSVGHCRNYVPTDVVARYHRMRGAAVLHPMGWDAFGLPAENDAILRGQNPRLTVPRHAANYRRQLTLVGCSYDWEREINSSDPEYYRWTQWFFLYLYRRGLAYRAAAAANWCPKDRTVLANEEVEDGRCWRCGTPVERRELPQWFFRITAYADRLLAGLETLDWPESILRMQRHWIGRSEGVEFDLEVLEDKNRDAGTGGGSGDAAGAESWPGALRPPSVRVFTTRPDTIGGVTFVVLAPEHPLVERIVTPERRQDLAAYVAQAGRRPEIERLASGREQTGVFTGAYARHPLSGTSLPIYVADYALATHGTGAIMGVPAHDERDFALAERYGLPILTVIVPAGPHPGALSREEENQTNRPASTPGREAGVPSGSSDASNQTRREALAAAASTASTMPHSPSGTPYEGEGILINSGGLDGLTSQEARAVVTALLEREAGGQRRVAYRLRDWLISRQRYWGAPIPILYCRSCGEVPVPEADLPVVLPEVEQYQPAGDGRSPLAGVPDWLHTVCPRCGGAAERETDTMGGFACSSWYFLRFASPHETERPFDPEAVRYWLPVDCYVGGAEHAVLHLLYARFWTKVMHDGGLIDFDEPFQRLRNQGIVHAADGRRMSKSRGNVVTPDSVVAAYGADVLRCFLLFLAPFEQDVAWSDAGIRGVSRWLNRVWKLVTEDLSPRPFPAREVETPTGNGETQPAVGEARQREGETPPGAVERSLQQTIGRVTDDMESFRFNTMIASLMELTGVLTRAKASGRLDPLALRAAEEVLLTLLAPSAPHLAEELWHRLGHTTSVHREEWPRYDAAAARDSEVTLVVQVNGRLRERLTVPSGLGEADAVRLALASPNVAAQLGGKAIRRSIYREDRLLNLVVDAARGGAGGASC